jgi:hypothetical protein
LLDFGATEGTENRCKTMDERRGTKYKLQIRRGQARRQAEKAFGQPPGAAITSSICLTMFFHLFIGALSISLWGSYHQKFKGKS